MPRKNKGIPGNTKINKPSVKTSVKKGYMQKSNSANMKKLKKGY